MLVGRSRAVLVLAAGLWGAACGGSDSTGTTSTTTPSGLTIVSGNGQVGLIGTALAQPLVVKVTSATGAPLAGIAVQFSVASGAATVLPSTAATDVTGQAKAVVTLGSSAGNVSVLAAVVGTNLAASFVVTAGTTSQTLACTSNAAQTPPVGGVLPGISGTGICLGAGAGGSDYALVAFFGNPDPSVLGQVNVTASGATALSTPDVAPLANVFATAPKPGFSMRTSDVQEQFDLKLRRIAQKELAPLVPGARAAMRSHALFNAIPSSLTVGQIVTLNANGTDGCTNAINVGARVVTISSTAYILADTANPTGGFADSDYASFATMFDTLINPLDVQTFGQPTDIDHNGKVVILFTKEVNKLTPRGSNGVVGGFFFDRDLFPTTSNAEFEGMSDEQRRRDVLRARARPQRRVQRQAHRVGRALAHAGHARARVSAPDQCRPAPLREHDRRLPGSRVAQRRAEPHRRRAVVLQGDATRAAAEHRLERGAQRVGAVLPVSGEQLRALQRVHHESAADVAVRRQRRPEHARRDVVPASLSRGSSRHERRRRRFSS